MARVTGPTAVLVTGCAGFIGSEFARAFAARFPKTNVIGIDDLSQGRRDVVPGSITFIKGSILDAKLLERTFAKYKPEYVFHFAALARVAMSVDFPFETNEANIGGTLRLLQAAKKHRVRRVIFSSSSSIYGGAKTRPTKEAENFPDPKSPYALQKYAGELYMKQWSALYGLDTVCLRYFNAYGPGQYGNSAYITVIAAWLESHFFPKNKKGFIEGDGTQSRDFSYIGDIIEANICAMQVQGPLAGENFNISSGKAYTLKQIRMMIEKRLGAKLKLEQRSPRIGDVKHTLADIGKAKKILGYRPATSFTQGLEASIAWFESRSR